MIASHLLPPHPLRYSFVVVFEDFTVVDRWTRKPVHCIYQALIVAIATRHADAVDVKFLVEGRTVTVALPHPAWVEYKKRTGRSITDSLAIEIAGHYLKTALESGEGLGRDMYSLTVEQTLEHLEAVVSEMQAPTPASV
ncbi:MAG: hypothetical protein WAN65_11275 [Candidatus Sulfotelmatobacter sp.]